MAGDDTPPPTSADKLIPFSTTNKNLFHDNMDARAINLDNELRFIKIEKMTINEYCTKIKSMADRLNNIGCVISEKKLLGGSPPSYQAVNYPYCFFPLVPPCGIKISVFPVMKSYALCYMSLWLVHEGWKVNADKHISGWNDGLSSLKNAGLEPYGHLGWKGDEDRNNWALSWTDMLRTDGAMVLAGEPPSDM
nr:hybrid signal transduction histidine kinase M [Tanacetum cinerariifolium]